MSLAAGATSRSVPGPKRILVAVANSKRMVNGRDYQPASSGNTLRNFVLWRGTAIMFATVSRHLA